MKPYCLLFDKFKVRIVSVGIFVVLVTIAFYIPGLSGIFLLDDFHTLKPIGDYGRNINTFHELSQYVFSGNTGPTGRPVALLTFVLNSQVWPTSSAFYFLLTNVVIHAINGVLFFVFLRQLLSYSIASSSFVFRVALVASLMWVLHPFHVSTVLYVVQRMTLLSATFSLSALIFYLMSRQLLLDGRLRKATPALFAAAASAMLALYSKENAITLPIQVMVIEAFLLTFGRARSGIARALYFVVVVPLSALFAGYLLWNLIAHVWDFAVSGTERTYGRSYTMSERLLTELRVVGDYLYATVIPQMQSSGVFQDGYLISKGFDRPLATFVWFVLHGLLVVSAWVFRGRQPAVFFGVFWFYASHLLESTTVMLEIKFDHRNYVPSMGIIFIIAFYISLIDKKLTRYCIQGSIIGVYSMFLVMSTNLWGDPLKSAMVWVEKNPFSARALGNAARQQYLLGNLETAKDYLRKEVVISNSPTSELVFIADFCETYDGSSLDSRGLSDRLAIEPRNWQLYVVLKEIVNDMVAERCNLLGLDEYLLLLDAYRKNPAYRQNLSLLLMDQNEIKAKLHFGQIDKAIERSEETKDIPLSYAMDRAGLFAQYDRLDYAVKFLHSAVYLPTGSYVEDSFTLQNAKEVLELMRKDLNKKVD